MSIYASGEMYLRGVRRLSQAADPVSRGDLARALGVADPVVGRVTEMLQGIGLLWTDSAGRLHLTAEGNALIPADAQLR